MSQRSTILDPFQYAQDRSSPELVMLVLSAQPQFPGVFVTIQFLYALGSRTTSAEPKPNDTLGGAPRFVRSGFIVVRRRTDPRSKRSPIIPPCTHCFASPCAPGFPAE